MTAESPSLPGVERDEAVAFASSYGIRHQLVQTNELARDGYRRNGADRCYFCKAELFEVMAEELAAASECDWPVLYGANADDLTDHRPGAQAATERGVLAPLADARLSKDDVRRFSREHGLITADKPSFACLSSRVPYGDPIDKALLGQLEAAEGVLRQQGFRQFRLRHHGPVARIEVLPVDLPRALELRDVLVKDLRAVGYVYVSLDLAGFRSGSGNDLLK